MKRTLLALAFLGASSVLVLAAPSPVIRGSVAVCDPNNPTSCLTPTGGGFHVGTYMSAGTGQYAISINTVTLLSEPPSAKFAEICVEGQSARYTDDGTTPTASIGIPVTVGTCFQYAGPLAAFQIIGQAAGGTIDVSYYK